MVKVSNVERLRPAILVMLRTTIDGAVQYRRLDIDRDHDEDGARVAKWETTRRIENPEEYAEAVKVRATVRNRVASACAVTSAFGLMCPLDKAKELDEALRESRQILRDFNATARNCRVTMAALRGEVSATDAEAIAAISNEVARMVREMERGIKLADPKKIREAADEAKALGAVLSDSARGKVTAAVDEARKAAREIVKRVQKGAEKAAGVVKSIETTSLRAAARTFLDLDESAPVETIAPTGAALDFSDDPTPTRPAPIKAAGLEV
jgi:uncharacterized membrane protein